MPPKKYNNAEEKKQAHREASLRYARKNADRLRIVSLNRYNEKKDKINEQRNLIARMGRVRPLL